jgi:hypothetical protein
MEFYIGMTFDGTYPPEAAAWCNKNNAHIEKVNGVKTIVENPPPPETRLVRTFAKDAIWVATKDMVIDEATGQTAWEAFKTFLLDSGLWEGWSMQAYLLEENPFFAEFYPRAVAVFGSELVDEVLAASVVETKTVIVAE